MNLFKILISYSCIKVCIVFAFYLIATSESYTPDYDEAFSKDLNYSPIWALHVGSDWRCVDTQNSDLTPYYKNGSCTINIGAKNMAYFVGDSHTGHLRGLLDQLIKNEEMNVFHTYKYSCPYADFADQECLNFYRMAFNWIKTQAKTGDSVVLSYFYRPFIDDWGDYNIPRKRISSKLVDINLRSMVTFAKNLNNEFNELGVDLIWVLNGPSPTVAPFILKDQGRWPYFYDESIEVLNQRIRQAVGDDDNIKLLDLEIVWDAASRSSINDENNCQRIGDRDNHHLSYSYSETLYKNFPPSVTHHYNVTEANILYDIRC